MSAVMELQGDKKGSSKRMGGTGHRWQKPAGFQEILLPGRSGISAHSFCNSCFRGSILCGFCSVLTAPDYSGPLRGH